MSIFLVGGPTTPEVDSTIWPDFVTEAARRARALGRDIPRVAVVLVAPISARSKASLDSSFDSSQADGFETVAAQLGDACEAVRVSVSPGGEVRQQDLAEIDGLYVGGGSTPDYRAALQAVEGEVRRLVAAGMPYAGFSAGAQLAAERAIVGGWRIGGVPVSPEPTGEGLDELTIEQGIGLIDISVDVHGAQWGTVGRLIAAVEAGLVEGGVVIDENTALVVGEGGLRVVGAGSVWQVLPSDSGVSVSTLGA